MTSATLSILHLICVHAEDRLVANEPRFQKEQTGTSRKRMKRKMREEEEKGKEEEATGNRGRGSLSCTNPPSGGLE